MDTVSELPTRLKLTKYRSAKYSATFFKVLHALNTKSCISLVKQVAISVHAQINALLIATLEI